VGARHILSRAMTSPAASTHLSFNGGKSQPGAGELRSSPTIAHLRKCRLAESTPIIHVSLLGSTPVCVPIFLPLRWDDLPNIAT
jgi:hypothetical protein